ncbi:MAG: hypothetical protein DRH56_03820 [Deltaproteobacteria bacterium]|nr:MAG: hypothetical protein DRH56_03820 [Deltaproteobacteria bacterium]
MDLFSLFNRFSGPRDAPGACGISGKDGTRFTGVPEVYKGCLPASNFFLDKTVQKMNIVCSIIERF